MITPEFLEKLIQLKAKASPGRVAQYTGRDIPRRIDLVSGPDVESEVKAINDLKEKIQELTREKMEKERNLLLVLHSHPVNPASAEYSPNGEADMDYLESLWNSADDFIELAKQALESKGKEHVDPV